MSTVFDKHSKITIVVISIIIFIVLDLMLSMVRNTIIENREKTSLGIKHPIYHHDFAKNERSKETGRLGDYTIYTNSLGFKDKASRKIAKTFDGRRIVIIGDSFTEGILLNYEDTFVGMIDSAVSDLDIEVLNAGRVSYSPIIYWRKTKYLLEEEELKFDELVVFLDISDIDDEASYYELSESGNVIYQQKYRKNDKFEERDYGLSWISNKTISRIKNFLKQNFFVTTFIINGIHDILFQDTLEIYEEADLNKPNEPDTLKPRDYHTWDYILDDYRSNWTFDDKYYNELGGELGKKRMIKYMGKLKTLCDQNGILLTVVIYPWPSQIWYEDLNSRHVKIWYDWCTEKDVKLINLFPFFIKPDASESERLQSMNKYYVPYDLHFNRAGNELVAKEFLKNYF